MRRPMIAGNWKMHMSEAEAKALIGGLKDRLTGSSYDAEVVVAPPFTALHAAKEALAGTDWFLAGQNAFWEEKGAFTGEISPGMLKDAGCSHVIIGHSERRQIMGETDEIVCKKLKAVLAAGLVPILCVGESLEQRKEGRMTDVIKGQLDGALKPIEADLEGKEWVVAYEPIWAIGTGETATPEQAQEVHEAIRKWIAGVFSSETAEATRILYGGSVKPENIAELMAKPDIDGALVGGASLKAESFSGIVDYKK